MKNFVKLAVVAGAVSLLAGCATYNPQGSLYNGVKTGMTANNNVSAVKTGQACSNSYLGLIAVGDASIESAKANGGITNVATINYTTNNVLGIYGEYCVVVSGN